ncbi:Spindle-body formation-associated protein [Purpureocillium lavendulum]|uniref:Spindle-body formation-associated protein n=1 Tax=Purpureocillium lavendulum TaxID=1247861 RepID=A0AB34FH60_9HYPO|nr:Spindle-body formation-associated protein [Purpureocillium lavendulum]
MLGWMLKRGENAPVADAEADTTQLDQPDTPAPVFAARAFKSALFGTPTASNTTSRKTQDDMTAKDNAKLAEPGSGTPSKPAGILLTPGTGTTRRKRVSFGRDVPASSDAGKGTTTKTTVGNRKTLLSNALENSRRKASEPSKTETHHASNDSEDEWEEDEDYCTNDITLDLNEPHSQSGRYWKGEFEKYHQEAKAEMEKLLKYKQLAKSYAQQKDAEAIQLAERLRDEQQRVIKMEKKIADNASQIVSQKRQSTDEEPTALLSKLAKQSSLAAQYRHRVQELETELDEFLRQKGEDAPLKGRRRRQVPPSPNTQKTLLETQRELRRARSQLRELDMLREEISSLKARVKVAEGHAGRADVDDALSAGGPRARELRAQLKQAAEDSKMKDDEIRRLKSEFESFRKEREVHEADTKAVLERAHTKIADLKKEVKSLKAVDPEHGRPGNLHALAERSAGAPEEAETKRRDRNKAQRKLSFGDMENHAPESHSLRDKYQRGENAGRRSALDVLTERPNLGQPKWQPFVPRSPRNRAYLGEALERRIRNGGATPAPSKTKVVSVPEQPGLTRPSRSSRSRRTGGNGEIDLLRDRFARLGGPESTGGDYISSSLVGNTSKGSMLPPDRRAAALARIEKRMADKKRAQRRKASYDKENIRA